MNFISTQSYILTLNNVTINEGKAQEFAKVFFLSSPPADLNDIEDTKYSTPVSHNVTITVHQLKTVINKISLNKASGSDEILNRLLKETFEVTKKHLLALMQASINQQHYPKPFKETTTIIIRKPGKPDYIKPNAYRPIALENTLRKILESIMTELICFLAESYHMLPTHHFGGRAGRTTEDAMIVLTEYIQEA